MSVRVDPDPAFPAGHARIVVPGGAGGAGSPGLRIQREEDWGDDKLGPLGWQTTEALLLPDRTESSGPDLVLHLGWAVCQHLEAGMYSLWVPGAGVEAAPVYWPDIVPMHAGALSVVNPATSSPVVPQAEAALPLSPVKPTPPQPAAPQQPGPAASPQAPHRSGLSNLLPWLLVLLVLLAGGGGAYWWLHGGAMPTEEARNQPAPETPPALPPAAPPLAPPSSPPAGLGGLSVPDVLAQAPNPAAIAAEGRRRLDGDRKDDGLLLLESASDRGDVAAAAALARLYDPVLFQPGGPIPRPDPRQAARYYRDAARGGMDVAAPREGLRKELDRRSASGDLGAGLSLKDFWP